MGWTMLWPFLDKLFGLGFATSSDKSWLSGTSPTFGFLKFGTKGPFMQFFQIYRRQCGRGLDVYARSRFDWLGNDTWHWRQNRRLLWRAYDDFVVYGRFDLAGKQSVFR